MDKIAEENNQPKAKKVEDKKFCACNCGGFIPIKINRNTGQPVKYIRGHQSYGQIGELNHNWKGGKIIDRAGYILVYCPTHPYNEGGYVFEHRLVVERWLGRYLRPEELIHHRNQIKTDNRIENLQVVTNAEHMIIHHRLRLKNQR